MRRWIGIVAKSGLERVLLASLSLSLSRLPIQLSPSILLLPLLFLSRSFSYIYILPSLFFCRMHPLPLHQPSPQRSPSSCAFLPYLDPTPLTFLLPLHQLFTGSTTSVSLHLAAFESSFSLPPIFLRNPPSFFRSVLHPPPIFGSCSPTPFLSLSSLYPSFSS